MHQMLRLLQKICSEIGTPLAHAVMALLDEGAWTTVQSLSLGPAHTYTSSEAYRNDLLIVDFIRKMELPDPSAASRRLANTMESFFRSEADCLRTNGFLQHLKNGYLGPHDVKLVDFISHWRSVIAKILGPIPRTLNPAYSPGSTLSDAGVAITIPDKMSSTPTCYPHSMEVVTHCVRGTELDRATRPRLERANRFFTVPKDSDKYRACCVEASLNISLQLAVGKEIRRRYNKYYKVDLTQLNDRHKLIAKAISKTGSHATIDLSSASDSVARELVRAVLPSDWSDLLSSLRATHTKVDGKVLYLEKFSSMGNGFTFELETLLFRSLITALGVGDDDASVFGDDIIVPSGQSGVVVNALRTFGFRINEKKTFVEGPFRESCGGDFFLGDDVRAVFVKKFPDEPQHWVEVHNQLLRWGGENRLRAARWYCVDQLPSDWRLFGPVGMEGCLHSYDATPVALGNRCTATHRKSGLSPSSKGFWVKEPFHRQVVVSAKWFKYRVVVASALYGTGERINLRDSVIGYRRKFVVSYGLSDSQASRRFGPELSRLF